jgi:Na+/H+-dicarboxylate symporter
MGIDVFLDMGRTATNVIGNSLATAAIAKWENKLGPGTDEDGQPSSVSGQVPDLVSADKKAA